MTMTEGPIATPAQKPARKPAKKRARRAPVAAKPPTPPTPKEFEGLSSTECCNVCNPDKCEISGINVCAHPFKGGLQSSQMNQHEVVRRFNRAKLALKDSIIDLRGGR